MACSCSMSLLAAVMLAGPLCLHDAHAARISNVENELIQAQMEDTQRSVQNDLTQVAYDSSQTLSGVHEIRGPGAKVPVVIATSPNLQALATSLRSKLGLAEASLVSTDIFTSGDANIRFQWEAVAGRKIYFLFDTVDQTLLFQQLALLQALQGFPVPGPSDSTSKWKTYISSGNYLWGRASEITVVLPWYRPCQMERTSRWELTGKADKPWGNTNPNGPWLDVPNALHMARLLATPGLAPALPGPSAALDGKSLSPLWRPPIQLLFIELHEEAPVMTSVSDLGATVRTERFVPTFLSMFRKREGYAGASNMYVLFPDHGALDRYGNSVVRRLGLAADHILFMDKAREGEVIKQSKEIFYLDKGKKKVKANFASTNQVLIIDDFTNSGSTLFGAIDLVKLGVPAGQAAPRMSIFVSHLVAAYSSTTVQGILTKLEAAGESTRFICTDSIPLTTNAIKGHPQVEVIPLADFIGDLLLA